MMRFGYVTAAQEVIFGAGSMERVGEVLARFGRRRGLLCTVNYLVRVGVVEQLAGQLGERLVATFSPVRPHVPLEQVQEALALAQEQEVDVIIGLGGGSPIGLAKAVSLALEEARTGRPARAAYPTDQPLIPVIAIPTTYAGSEMTPIYGVTQLVEGTARKVTVTDGKVTPKVAMYDPTLTLATPAALTAASGINALAHAIEAVYSPTRHPLSTAAALSAVRHIYRALPQATADGDDLAARTEMMLGAHLAAVSLATVKMGLHHGLCHVLGGTAGVGHGEANSIMLPHVVRFNLAAARPELAEVAQVMGVIAAERLPDVLYEFIGRLNLPQRLRDVGVSEEQLSQLAQVAMKSAAVQNNVRPVKDAAEVEDVYRAAW
jgi:alcohol dehydrogenase class IV